MFNSMEMGKISSNSRNDRSFNAAERDREWHSLKCNKKTQLKVTLCAKWFYSQLFYCPSDNAHEKSSTLTSSAASFTIMFVFGNI